MKKVLILIALFAMGIANNASAQNNAKPALNNVLNAYYEAKNALAKDNKDEAKEKVAALVSKVSAVKHNDLKGNEHKVWMEQAGIIQASAKTFDAATDIKTQRKAFEGISSAMIKTVRNIKFNNNTVYVQHCPMAKASWKNEKEAIENPYYGSMMFDCGDVAETIKSK